MTLISTGRHIKDEIEHKVEAGKRLDREEGVFLMEEGDLLWLGLLANHVRRRKHPQRIVTYVVDRNINYTNICVSACRFCAFFRSPGEADGYLLSREELHHKIEETLELGGTQILMQGGLHPELRLDYYTSMFRGIKENCPIHLHCLSPPEIVHLARLEGMEVAEVIGRLKEAGLDSIPGGGAEILVDRVRRLVAENKCTTDEWLEVMREAHGLGMRTTATMMFHHVETLAERVEHLLRVRELQDATGGFTAFIPWPFQPDNTALGGPRATGVDYLRTLAVCRIMLDNVDNIQASWVTQGAKVAQVALEFGANDFGSTMIEENVVAAAGACFRMSEEEIVRYIEDAGYIARQRDQAYNLL
jgi:cyclic dehypoxanthinyl futalosine synthase